MQIRKWGAVPPPAVVFAASRSTLFVAILLSEI